MGYAWGLQGCKPLRAAAGPPAIASALRKVGALKWGICRFTVSRDGHVHLEGKITNKSLKYACSLLTSTADKQRVACADTQRWARRS